MDLKNMEEMLNEDDEDVKEPDNEDEDDDEDIEDESFFEQHKIKIFIGVGTLVAIALGVFFYISTRPEPLPPPPIYVPAPTPDPWLEAQRELYEAGIGAHFIDEATIFEQGNIESFTFRQDFSQVDQPEMFVQPIRIDNARDSMSYTRHRAVTAPGVEVYWLEGEFRGRRIVTTIPYALYQLLPPSGVVAIDVEVVTDAEGSITITYVRPLPPTAIQGR